ncbi:DUF2752 domain-containing protein [Natronoglycomyces albus]|uniref:DUF2752 domain-containing protein n=1 Tax=Natronoglycomyces albus TaxID=2811108 RepID=A0A895XMR3_9ACTN|nr:DUF2752 domain-containing protein [Natronoglycomyces albus]QSB04315.1 DUF2752 domain-containing protein [Natronoglycomyces albus]
MVERASEDSVPEQERNAQLESQRDQEVIPAAHVSQEETLEEERSDTTADRPGAKTDEPEEFDSPQDAAREESPPQPGDGEAISTQINPPGSGADAVESSSPTSPSEPTSGSTHAKEAPLADSSVQTLQTNQVGEVRPPAHPEQMLAPPVKEPGPIKRFFALPWVGPVAVLLGFATAAAAVLYYNPTNEVGPTTCAFKLMTGFDCPGCGGTRAFYYTLTFNLPEAARNHAMALFAAPFLTWMFAQWSVPRLFPRLGWRWPVFVVTPRITFWFLGVWAVYWIARNLPWEPFIHLYV